MNWNDLTDLACLMQEMPRICHFVCGRFKWEILMNLPPKSMAISIGIHREPDNPPGIKCENVVPLAQLAKSSPRKSDNVIQIWDNLHVWVICLDCGLIWFNSHVPCLRCAPTSAEIFLPFSVHSAQVFPTSNLKVSFVRLRQEFFIILMSFRSKQWQWPD